MGMYFELSCRFEPKRTNIHPETHSLFPLLQDLPRNVQELLGLSEGKSPTPSTDTASSPQPLSPSQAQEMELTDSVSPSQPDSSIEILPTEEASTSQSLSP